MKDSMVKIFLVGIGGFFGSISRYLVSGFIYRAFGKPWFPYGTLGVNVIGCFFIGLLYGISESRQLFSPEIRLLVFIGFLGSFTTFSTFGYELFTFARDSQISSLAANIFLHLVMGFGAVWFGFSLSKLF